MHMPDRRRAAQIICDSPQGRAVASCRSQPIRTNKERENMTESITGCITQEEVANAITQLLIEYEGDYAPFHAILKVAYRLDIAPLIGDKLRFKALIERGA